MTRPNQRVGWGSLGDVSEQGVVIDIADRIVVPFFDRTFLWHFRGQWLPDEYMDGDTFTVLPDTGYDGRHEVAIRLEGIDAPERYDPGGPEATERLRSALLRATAIKWNLRIISKQRIRVVVETKTFERFVSTVFVVIGDYGVDVRTYL